MVGVVLKHALQMSDSVEVAAFLAFSGGVMDAYSYLVRGGVFANAQTGNLLLFGINLTSHCARRTSALETAGSYR